MENRKYNPLSIKHISDAAGEAGKEIADNIQARKDGRQTALMTRWSKINSVLLGGWRFKKQYAICGASGSGKSFFLNMIYQDFVNAQLNSTFTHSFKILHFNFEMPSSDEVIRTISGDVSKSYREIISADSMLSETDHALVKRQLDALHDKPIYFVESMGNVQQIYDTIMHFQSLNPHDQLVIGIDHTLLTGIRDERSEVELISKLSRMFLSVRKKISSMNLLICQLNDKIEDPARIANPGLHFPKKMDIHGAKAVYRDADYVMVLHAPEKLGIESYGRKHWETKDLIALHLLKGRQSDDGMVIRLRSKLAEGKITEWADVSDTGQFNLTLS